MKRRGWLCVTTLKLAVITNAFIPGAIFKISVTLHRLKRTPFIYSYELQTKVGIIVGRARPLSMRFAFVMHVKCSPDLRGNMHFAKFVVESTQASALWAWVILIWVAFQSYRNTQILLFPFFLNHYSISCRISYHIWFI